VDRIGRYDVLRELGAGGMGRVYLGMDRELERKVALKLLHREDRVERARFRGEARALAALNHPHIVTIYEIGEHAGQRFIAMEYLEGRSLRELLVDPALRPSRERLVAICARIADALVAAHAAGILHRDIKPENVIVADDGMVKVVDFGIARRLGAGDNVLETGPSRALSIAESLTQTLRVPAADALATLTTAAPAATRTVFGTPAYMAPEVLMGEETSPASDVYSLGVLLYECLSGRRPHEGLLHEVIAKVVDGSEDPEPLDDPLGALALAMLARDPIERPVLRAISRALAPKRLATVAPRRSRGTMLATFGAAGLAIAVVAGWSVLRDQQTEGSAALAIAVEPIDIELHTYGADAPNQTVVGEVLAAQLGAYAAISAVSPATLERQAGPTRDLRSAARVLHVRWLLRGRIREAQVLEARFELVELSSETVTELTVTAPAGQLPQLVTNAAYQIAATLHPHVVPPAPDRARAITLYVLGTDKTRIGDWTNARCYLEQAVVLDPSFAEAWQALASARGWSVAPQSLIEQAVERSVALAPPGPRRELWRGVQQFYRSELGAAIATLRPLVERTDLTPDDRKNLDYYLGEAYFHDGDHDAGVHHLQKVIDGLWEPFRPAATHLGEYALVRGDFATAARHSAYGPGPLLVDLARGNYQVVAGAGMSPLDLHAHILMGVPPPPPLVERLQTSGSWRRELVMWRYATADGAAARTIFDELWPELTSPAAHGLVLEIGALLEIALARGRGEDLARILDELRPRGLRGLRRFELLAAPLLGKQPAITRDKLSSREREIVDATAAELAGDHARAVEILERLVANPSTNWDYPERAALFRNLRALGRAERIRTLCEDLRAPKVFRYAWIPLRAGCP
jgi:predicted Ser/Thr protein kinase/tetratricopeptide (TPR) repeat protein